MKDVAGKTAFITGGASGMGLGMAIAFAQAGMKVAIADLREKALEEAMGYFAPEHQVMPVLLDVTDRARWPDAVAEVQARDTPGAVQREAGQRRLVVGFNVRGGDLGTVVEAAQAAVEKEKGMPNGYRLQWGGQYETMQAARARMAIVIPVTLAGILAVLLWTFGRLVPALLILLNVPFAGVGGVVALAVRDLPISMSAAVGFIALSGIAVLNGVVLMTTMLDLRAEGRSWRWSQSRRPGSA